MATRLHLENTQTADGPDAVVFDLVSAITGSLAKGINVTTVGGATQQQLADAGSPVCFVSQRLAAEVMISGTISLSLFVNETDLNANAAIRVTVSKITVGGSDIESVIASGDSGAELTTSVVPAVTFTITPPVPVVVATNERLIVRLYAIPAPGQTLGNGFVVECQFGSTSTFDSWVEFTEALSFIANGTVLIARRTTTAAIGNFFDLLTTLGTSAFTTGVVNTVAGGTDIQWTRTAGGTVLEWISGRCRQGFRFETPPAGQKALTCIVWAFESAAQANAAIRMRMYRWRAGTETVCCQFQIGLELGTASATATLDGSSGGSTLNTVDFLPDDRLVLRFFIMNATSTTMGSGRTCTVEYDALNSSQGFTRLTLFADVLFKDESEPNALSQIPGGLTMGGVGN
jgi:hypothetical protein